MTDIEPRTLSWYETLPTNDVTRDNLKNTQLRRPSVLFKCFQPCLAFKLGWSNIPNSPCSVFESLIGISFFLFCANCEMLEHSEALKLNSKRLRRKKNMVQFLVIFLLSGFNLRQMQKFKPFSLP